ncbi:MAG: caspase family protein [Smithellaceae bacterium]|nr:caspase family protein [Smithellaceae bacterium]
MPIFSQVGVIPDVTNKLPLEAALYISDATRGFSRTAQTQLFIHKFLLGEKLDDVTYRVFSQVFDKVTVISEKRDLGRFDILIEPTFLEDKTTVAATGGTLAAVALNFHIQDRSGIISREVVAEEKSSPGAGYYGAFGPSTLLTRPVETAAVKIWRMLGERQTLAVLMRGKPQAVASTVTKSDVESELLSDVDVNVPRTAMSRPAAIAVLIGNRDYRNAKKVDFALSDAHAVGRYLTSALGFKEGNIFYLDNATKGDFELFFGIKGNCHGRLYNTVKTNESEVFIFYSGHGAPGLKDRRGYFVPVEADPQYIELGGYPLDLFYENIAQIPARLITVVTDACFSGADIYEGISPMVMEIEKPQPARNIIIVSSSTGRQVSSWYNEKGHGLFTYYFLKTMQEGAGAGKDRVLTFDELFRRVSDQTEGVPYFARRLHGVEQTPTIEGPYRGEVFLRY